ncbi:hypothetical protein IB268_26470 [Achromobacter sp. ACM01]|uniref:hypothetical protein n=1 Tax=Achromobacter sp. ACM01 TaxID=2769298 RepID=UPI001784D825|nr:hypothetical protein [Achromobacter sp. ACM01]MBD9476483.1 hypothetical protein [Achromobacter sp. ACM01]
MIIFRRRAKLRYEVRSFCLRSGEIFPNEFLNDSVRSAQLLHVSVEVGARGRTPDIPNGVMPKPLDEHDNLALCDEQVLRQYYAVIPNGFDRKCVDCVETILQELLRRHLALRTESSRFCCGSEGRLSDLDSVSDGCGGNCAILPRSSPGDDDGHERGQDRSHGCKGASESASPSGQHSILRVLEWPFRPTAQCEADPQSYTSKSNSLRQPTTTVLHLTSFPNVSGLKLIPDEAFDQMPMLGSTPKELSERSPL